MSGLPRGWAEVELREVVLPIESCDPSQAPDQSFRYVDIGSINNQSFSIEKPKTVLGREAPSRARRRIRHSDVLFSTVRTYLKNIAMVPKSLDGEVTSTGIAVLRSSQVIIPDFLFGLVRSEKFIRALSLKQDGTLYPAITDRDLLSHQIGLPPLAEQKRIVAELRALSAKSACARTELARIETLVSRYKKAMLSRAFSGELVGLIPDATEKPHALCWDLPLGWRWVAFEDAVEIASNLVNPNTIPELPHIAPDNIESGTARLLPFKTIGEDGVISAKHRFFAGQILYSKIRPYLRKAVIADFDGACSADMYPLSPRDALSAPYLLQWLISEQFTHFAVEHQGRTVLPKINQTALNKTPLPLPPLATQHEIVLRVESAFARIDRLAKEAKRALDLVGRLDEAILVKAFRGELVPQDENDEPAEHLLARIRAKREAAPKVKKRAVKRTNAMLTARDFLNAKLPNWPNDGISFQDLRNEFSGSYEDLKDAVFALLSDKNAPLRQAFDEQHSTMTLRRREQ